MSALRRIARRIALLVRRRTAEAEMAEEMSYHLEQRAAEFAAEGLSEEEARLAAQRKFGNTGSIQERAREAWGWRWLERVSRDIWFAVRQLARSPGFTALAIVTLGLGIGVNTAMFSTFNSLLLRPLPYPDAAQLDRIFRATPQNQEGSFSAADFGDFRREAGAYGEIAGYSLGEVVLSEPNLPAQIESGARVTANFFSLLRVSPEFGRDFLPQEETPGSDRVVVLSRRCWLNRFGGARDIVGRTIRIDAIPHTVVGVLPAWFNDWRHLGNIDFFRPLGLEPAEASDRRILFLRILGRRSADHSPKEAGAIIANFGTHTAAGHPAENAGGVTWRTVSLAELVAGRNGPTTFAMLICLSGFVLLIACSNLANLLLARTMARAREFAVRGALGASRLQLLRPLIAESFLLALAGAAFAMLVAMWLGEWLAFRSTGDNGERVQIYLEWRAMAWAVGAALITAIAFGLAPSLFALRLDLNKTLKAGGRGAIGGRGHHRFRQLLVVGQFALAMILLSGAALHIRGLDELNKRRSGWDSDHLVSGTVLLPGAKYSGSEAVDRFYRTTTDRLSGIPGVSSVGIASFMPYFNWTDSRKYFVEGTQLPEAGKEPSAVFNSVSPDYFRAVGTHLLAGRGFSTSDRSDASPVFIISESLARKLFADADPLGKRIALAAAEPRWGEIVGVVNDVVSSAPSDTTLPHQVYQPVSQEPRLRFELAVRGSQDSQSTLVDSVRRVMADIDPDLPIRKLQGADATISRANYQQGVLRDVLTTFAALGLGLASLGIYGVVSRVMAQRTGEFAIRLAIGAGTRDIVRLVLGSGLKQALAGSLIGLVGAIAVARLLSAGFPNMRLESAPVLVGTTLLLAGVALLACWLPARKAGRVNPVDALRAE